MGSTDLGYGGEHKDAGFVEIFGSSDSGKDGEHTNVGSVQISDIFVMKSNFLL